MTQKTGFKTFLGTVGVALVGLGVVAMTGSECSTVGWGLIVIGIVLIAVTGLWWGVGAIKEEKEERHAKDRLRRTRATPLVTDEHGIIRDKGKRRR